MRTIVLTVAVCAALAQAALASPVHEAASGGDLEAVKTIVSSDAAQATAANVRNDTPIHLAVAGGHIDVVRYLLDQGVPVDIGDNEGTTPLSVAAIHGEIDIGRLLIDRGARIDATDVNGETPLHWAAYNGQPEFVRMLIEMGADINARKTNGSTPLHGAAFYDHPDCVRLLLENGADTDARTSGLYTPFLSGAAGQGGMGVITALVDAGVDVHDRNDQGENAVMLAARAGKPDVVEYLMMNGVSIYAKSNDAGRSATHYAAMNGNVEILRMLTSTGARVDEESDGGWTPLFWAVLRGQSDAALFLLEKGADPNIEGPDGNAILTYATREWQPEVVRGLLEHGADPNAREEGTGRTLLHQMALAGVAEGVTMALEAGADVDTKDDAGMTAIQYAARYGHRGAAEVLEARGASTRKLEKNYDGCEALKKEVRTGQASMVYLGHCGWALKTESHLLVFDYWSGWGTTPDEPALVNGHIDPAEIADLDVCVFVTHEHSDHFDPVIFEWADRLPNVTYVYGFRPELLPQYREAGYPGPEYVYVGPRESATVDGMEVRTVAANDAGVGFLVDVDGLTLFHAGDHAGWAEGERDGYIAEIDYIAPFVDGLDMAFVNVTGCHTHDPEALLEGNLYTIRTLEPRLIIPTHGAGREYVYEEAREAASEAGVQVPFCCPANRGDSYFYGPNGLM